MLICWCVFNCNCAECERSFAFWAARFEKVSNATAVERAQAAFVGHVPCSTASRFKADCNAVQCKRGLAKVKVVRLQIFCDSPMMTINLLLAAIVHGSRRERSRGLINGLTGRRFAVARRACRLRRQQFAAAVLWCNPTRGSTVWAALRRLPLFPAVASPATMPTHMHLCHLLLWVCKNDRKSLQAWNLKKKTFPLERASSDGC